MIFKIYFIYIYIYKYLYLFLKINNYELLQYIFYLISYILNTLTIVP